MFCGYCGAKIPDGSEFCGSCGKPVNKADGQQSAAPDGSPAGTGSVGTVRAAAAPAKSGKRFIVPVALALAAVVAVVGITSIASHSSAKADEDARIQAENDARDKAEADERAREEALAKEEEARAKEEAESQAQLEEQISQLEDAIYTLTGSQYMDEDEIVRLYNEYDSLSDTAKRMVINRDSIITAYQQLLTVIDQRKQDAAKVDNLIAAIDYTNIYTEASTVRDAVIAYHSLDERTAAYVAYYDTLLSAYNQVGNLNVQVTAENINDLFAISFSVGEQENYGNEVEEFTGYTFDWNKYIDEGTYTPNYSTSYHDDYATPVHVYIAARYPGLASSCSFHIDLHQTYTGLGLIDSDIHEFKLQSADITYDASQGVLDTIIYVENNDAAGSVWDSAGMSFDVSDMFHQMNDFDISRVRLTNISGSVSY